MAKYGEHSSAWELGQTGGGGAAPGWDAWQLVRGKGAQGAATRTVKERSGTTIPSAASWAHIRFTF